ncbi:hypothetical protein JR325_gp138 [Escherichia phage tuntematon]|uniref:Uncharacterized protein n=2 Tax=Phapecoctavirus TaxID=2733124 RepID=A0A6B9WUW5_9CAUD|nr:hypothetical protein JR324_gp224 [Escherichia phage nieznany]YP_009986514.1 hypothetical protein JR325_gp138 [Escherichia phage tuntematon]QHR69557.1 hypothetical protein nieznany_224 [Escherichia phage nieznany]QHR71994.1 hypothetical protein tuntematon_138 [Escherichia phage tuntematon]
MKFEKFTAVGVAILEVRGDGWSAGFYLKPNIAVKVYGNKPDLNEFRDACALSMFPLPAIDALYAAACVAFEQRHVPTKLAPPYAATSIDC